MRYSAPMTLAILLVIPLLACDVTIDVDADPARAGVSTLDPLPEPGPDVDVWTRRSDVLVFDDAIQVDLRLALHDDGTYRFVAEIVEDRGERDRSVSEGRYRWRGDRLILIDGGGETATLTRREDELELETAPPVNVVRAVTGLPAPTLRRMR